MKRILCAVVLAALVAGCGGGGDDDGGDEESTATTSGLPPTSVGLDDEDTSTTADEEELPQFLDDFDRVCTTQVGYPGAADYEAGPGVHPVVLFEDYRGGDLVQSSRDLPEGWKIEEDADFNDNSELAEAQLVACSNRTEERPTGVKCDFENNDDEAVTLELVDASYELVVYEAQTGEELQRSTLEGSEGGECPFIATFEEGDTTYVSEPDDEAYINALKPLVAP